MAIRVHLGEKDRERWGCAEALELDLMDTSIADVSELSERFGFEPDDWPDAMIGDIPFEQAGSPDARPVQPRWQKHAAVWLALHQAGHDATWDDVGKVSFLRAGYSFDGKEDPGKEEGESPSPTSDDSGTPPSDTSSE